MVDMPDYRTIIKSGIGTDVSPTMAVGLSDAVRRVRTESMNQQKTAAAGSFAGPMNLPGKKRKTPGLLFVEKILRTRRM
jgi:hypothetical protein